MVVLLMTTGTGAVGYDPPAPRLLPENTDLIARLNLTAANRIHLLEPQWNPSIEEQAIGRALRLGQTRPVTVIRYIVQNTVEEVCMREQIRIKLTVPEHPVPSGCKVAASEVHICG